MAAGLGTLLIADGVFSWNAHGATSQFANGRAVERLEAAANARQIEAQYRRQEQEMAADYAARLEKANEATRTSIADRDLVAGAAGSLRNAIDTERTRAAQAAARAGPLSEPLPEPGTYS